MNQLREQYSKIDCEMVVVREKAFLIRVEGKEYWIPRSCCQNGHKEFSPGDEVILLIADWVADEKGLL